MLQAWALLELQMQQTVIRKHLELAKDCSVQQCQAIQKLCPGRGRQHAR